MAAASEGVQRDPRVSTSPRSKEEESSAWEEFKEWLVPSEAFSRSFTPKKDLAFARIATFIFYVCLFAFFIYTTVRLLFNGRIELFSNLYKVDFVEAPSLAFCPFNLNETILWQGSHPWVSAIKWDLNGSHQLDGVAAKPCEFDRVCGCVDMRSYRLSDSARELHPGGHSMVFREAIEIRTNLSDPSSDGVLKVGIYDSRDMAPDWLYVNEGAMFIAQLELIIWTVVDISVQGVINTIVNRDWRAMAKNRHIFRYTSQQVGDGRHLSGDFKTSVRYEMKTFFVEETMSSHRAFSLYTVGVLIALVALRWVFVDAFYLAVMPEWSEKKNEALPTHRELTSTSVWIREIFCCCLKEASDDPSERDPLIESKDAPA
jgi:hypothetical protein